MNASQLHSHLLTLEVSGNRAADFRRLVSKERQTLYLALQSCDRKRIAKAYNETLRVLQMWESVEPGCSTSR